MLGKTKTEDFEGLFYVEYIDHYLFVTNINENSNVFLYFPNIRKVQFFNKKKRTFSQKKMGAIGICGKSKTS